MYKCEETFELYSKYNLLIKLTIPELSEEEIDAQLLSLSNISLHNEITTQIGSLQEKISQIKIENNFTQFQISKLLT